MSMRYITVVPAYGRDYKSGPEALAAWGKGHDFVIEDFEFGGTYINRFDDHPDNWVISIRYNKLRRIVAVI